MHAVSFKLQSPGPAQVRSITSISLPAVLSPGAFTPQISSTSRYLRDDHACFPLQLRKPLFLFVVCSFSCQVFPRLHSCLFVSLRIWLKGEVVLIRLHPIHLVQWFRCIFQFADRLKSISGLGNCSLCESARSHLLRCPRLTLLLAV